MQVGIRTAETEVLNELTQGVGSRKGRGRKPPEAPAPSGSAGEGDPEEELPEGQEARKGGCRKARDGQIARSSGPLGQWDGSPPNGSTSKSPEPVLPPVARKKKWFKVLRSLSWIISL